MESGGPGGGAKEGVATDTPTGLQWQTLADLSGDHLHSHAEALRDHQDVTEDDGTIQFRIPFHRLEGELLYCQTMQ